MDDDVQFQAYAKAAKSVGGLTIIRILGAILVLVQTALYASFFGVGNEMDVFFAATVLFNITNKMLQGGAFNTVFLPFFTEVWDGKDHRRAWEITSNLLNVLFICSLLLSGVFFWFSPFLTSLSVPGFNADKKALVLAMFRMLLPVLFFGLLNNVMISVLHVLRRFVWVDVTTTLLAPGVGLLALYMLVSHMGIWSLPLSVLTASIVQFLFLLGLLFRNGFRYTLSFKWKDPILRKTVVFVGPSVASKLVVQLRIFVTTALVSYFPQGSLALLNYAESFFSRLSLLALSPITTVAYPSLAKAALTEKSFTQFRQVISNVFRTISLVTIPLTIFLILLRTPIIQIIFERGRFESKDTAMLSAILFYFLLCLLPEGLHLILKQALFALKRPFRVASLTMASQVVSLILMVGLIKPFGFLGIAMAIFLTALFIGASYYLTLCRFVPRMPQVFLTSFYLKITVSAIALGVVVIGTHEALRFLDVGFWAATPILQIVTPGVTGSLVFLFLIWKLRLEEFQIAVRLLKQQIGI